MRAGTCGAGTPAVAYTGSLVPWVPGMKTGYEISFSEFLRLCSRHREEVGPLLQLWFGHSIIPAEDGFELRDHHGRLVDPERVHDAIQADAERQGTIYRVAMTLWR